MKYQAPLDGIRGVAILVVMLFHARAPAALGGYAGVDLFFVLSGFLITSILLEEIDASGRVTLWRFYLRRIFRLTPALLLMLTAYVVVAPWAWPNRADHMRQAAIAALYLSDYAVAFYGTPDFLSHTWSLSVEEHFYLIWPLLLLGACRRWDRRSLIVALAAGYLITTAWRWYWTIRGQSWDEVYYRFDTRTSGLFLGACLAALRRDPELIARTTKSVPALLWIAVIGTVLCLRSPWGHPWMMLWGFTAAEWCGVALILAVQSPGGQVAAMLSIRPLVLLGKLSYGVYLWHYPVFRWLRVEHPWDETFVVGLAISIALAAISFFTVEAWAKSARERLEDWRQAGAIGEVTVARRS